MLASSGTGTEIKAQCKAHRPEEGRRCVTECPEEKIAENIGYWIKKMVSHSDLPGSGLASVAATTGWEGRWHLTVVVKELPYICVQEAKNLASLMGLPV